MLEMLEDEQTVYSKYLPDASKAILRVINYISISTSIEVNGY